MGRVMPSSRSAFANSAACAAAVQERSRGPVAVSKSRPVENNGAVMAGGLIEHAADQHVLDHRAVAVHEHDRLPLPRSM